MTEPPSPFAPPSASLELPATPQLGGGTRTTMEYLDAYQCFFKAPRWGMNLLLLGVCVLIPFVGVIVNQGYYAIMNARRHQRGEVIPPEFDFKFFGNYLERGIWPFLASLIAAFAALPVLGVTIGLIVVAAQVDHRGVAMASGVGAFILGVSFGLVMFLAMRPILIRAAFTQGLSGVYSLTFIADFSKKMWLEMFLSQLFLFVTALPLAIAGYLMCGLGLYPAAALISFAAAQLDLQLYEVYLSRGGIAVPIDARLLA